MVQTKTPVEHPTASSEARKVWPLNRFLIIGRQWRRCVKRPSILGPRWGDTSLRVIQESLCPRLKVGASMSYSLINSFFSSYRAEYDCFSDLTRSIEWPPGHRRHPSLLFILEQRHEGGWRFVLKIRLNKNGSNRDFLLALISWLSTSEWFHFMYIFK